MQIDERHIQGGEEMRYIRTEDGRIVDTTKEKVSLGYHPKEADTILELCDEFDWKWNETEFPYSIARQHDRYDGYGDLKRAMRGEENYGKYLNQDYEIYGAIWTDKGLIYVAKINEKGELELL